MMKNCSSASHHNWSAFTSSRSTSQKQCAVTERLTPASLLAMRVVDRSPIVSDQNCEVSCAAVGDGCRTQKAHSNTPTLIYPGDGRSSGLRGQGGAWRGENRSQGSASEYSEYRCAITLLMWPKEWHAGTEHSVLLEQITSVNNMHERACFQLWVSQEDKRCSLTFN